MAVFFKSEALVWALFDTTVEVVSQALLTKLESVAVSVDAKLKMEF